jgi:hypothetical protein
VNNGHDIPDVVDNVHALLNRVRHIVDCIHDHHKDHTDDGRALLLDIVEIHSNMTAVEGLMEEIRESAEEAWGVRGAEARPA